MAGFTVKGGTLDKTGATGTMASTATETAANKTALGLMRVYIITEGAPSIAYEAKVVNLSQNKAITSDGFAANTKMILEASISSNATEVEEEEGSNANCRDIIFKASDADYADGSLRIRLAGYSDAAVTVLVAIQNVEDGPSATTNIAVKETVAAELDGEIVFIVPFTVGALS